MTSIPGMEENIIQGIDDNYSRHEGHVLKAGRKSIPDMTVLNALNNCPPNLE
jgi:hypothetical protein